MRSTDIKVNNFMLCTHHLIAKTVDVFLLQSFHQAHHHFHLSYIDNLVHPSISSPFSLPQSFAACKAKIRLIMVVFCELKTDLFLSSPLPSCFFVTSNRTFSYVSRIIVQSPS